MPVESLGSGDYTAVMARGKMAVFGVPSAAGARSSGVSEAPTALRQAGLLEALAQGQTRVVNLSDLSLFPFREDNANPKARNASVVACAARATSDEMGRALREGFSLILGGDCTLLVGVALGARAALGCPVGLVYLDANADLNTPETSPSGFLNGMALSLALGDGPVELISAGGKPPAVRPHEAVLLGFRAIDPGEKGRLSALAMSLGAGDAKRLGMKRAAASALEALPGNGPIVVHMDVDLIDPRDMPAKDCVTPGPGLTPEEAEELLGALLSSPRTVALLVAEFHPGKDPGGHAAARLVHVLSRAVARRFAAER
jgi:arginase